MTPRCIRLRFSLAVRLVVGQYAKVSFSLEWMGGLPHAFNLVCGAGFSHISVFCMYGTSVSLVSPVSFPSFVFNHYKTSIKIAL